MDTQTIPISEGQHVGPFLKRLACVVNIGFCPKISVEGQKVRAFLSQVSRIVPNRPRLKGESKVKEVGSLLNQLSSVVNIGACLKISVEGQAVRAFLSQVSRIVPNRPRLKRNFKVIDLGPFLRLISNKMQEYEVNNRITGDKFSVFSYLKKLNEKTSSTILKDLLNPKGNHGQGPLFLENFLELCGLDKTFLPAPTAKIRCEAPTYSLKKYNRRMDILIESHQRALAIENKLWAGDQEDQVSDYLCHLENIAKNGFYLIYLTREGHAPSEFSLPFDYSQRFKENFKSLSWSALLMCLTKCREQVQAPKISFFLFDFVRKIEEILEISMEDNHVNG